MLVASDAAPFSSMMLKPTPRRSSSSLQPLTTPARLQPVAFSEDNSNNEVVTAEGMFGDIAFDDPVEPCLPRIAHRSGIWGELMYLRARDAEVTYALPVNGSLGGPPFSTVPIGSLGVVDPDQQHVDRRRLLLREVVHDQVDEDGDVHHEEHQRRRAVPRRPQRGEVQARGQRASYADDEDDEADDLERQAEGDERRDLEKQIFDLLSALGFNPAARSRLGLAEVKAQSKLEEIRERQAKRAAMAAKVARKADAG